MSVWTLKCGEDVDVTYTIVLEGLTYDFRIKWIDRDESWECYVGLTGQDPSASFKITNGFNLLKPYHYKTGVPPGSLFATDLVSIFGRVDFDNFGIDKRFRLVYFDSTETDTF